MSSSFMCKTCLEYDCSCNDVTKTRRQPSAKAKHIHIEDVITDKPDPAWHQALPKWLRKHLAMYAYAPSLDRSTIVTAIGGEVLIRDQHGQYAIINANKLIEILEAAEACARAQRRLKNQQATSR